MNVCPDLRGRQPQDDGEFLLDHVLDLVQGLPFGGGQGALPLLKMQASCQQHQLADIPAGEDLLELSGTLLAVGDPGHLVVPNAGEDAVDLLPGQQPPGPGIRAVRREVEHCPVLADGV